MRTGTVVGKVWASKRVEELPSGALLEVRLGGDETIVAFDPLGCGEGEKVLVTFDDSAAAWFKGRVAVIDALIVGSLDD